MLTTLEGRELALRDIIESGYYIGSDASYNIKQLLEADYVVQKRSVHDKRPVKVSLAEKGEELCKKLVIFNAAQPERLAGSKQTTAQLNATMDVLRNLENSWSEYFRYGSV
jgi:DNA-binding MarR family transcriptional regulator